MNKAKKAAEINGKEFLKSAYAAEQNVLSVKFDFSAKSITHDGVMGGVNEQHLISFLRKYLPHRYSVDQGIVIDSNGATSDQIDVVIFDNQYTPTLLDQSHHRFIPAEAVYAVFEVKPQINKDTLKYAAKKAKSVRALKRTSISIRHAGGEFPAKPAFKIISGIISHRVDWKNGLKSNAFSETLKSHKNNYTIDCGVSLTDRAFDNFNDKLEISDKEGSLTYFVFRLLQKLQSLGTVPAIDWNAYADAVKII